MKQNLILILIITSSLNSLLAQKVYHVEWKRELTLLGISTSLFVGKTYLEYNPLQVQKSETKFYGRNNIWKIDRSALSNYSTSAAKTSDYLLYGLYAAPFTLLLRKRARENGLEIYTMLGEAILFNRHLTKFTKLAIGRPRPYMYNPAISDETKADNDGLKSFYSGHVSTSATLSFFCAKVYSDLYPDSPWRYGIWTVASVAPIITGYYRYKAGKHFPTDIAAGYLIGASIGYLIPKLHTMSNSQNIDISIGVGLVALEYRF